MRRQVKHLGGTRPFGYRLVKAGGGPPTLVPEPAEQAAIERMRTMRQDGGTLFAIRDTMGADGFTISHETVRQVLVRSAV